ncbi:MAG: B12-binding domain-containing radical SAM protein [Aggregatilineales bacterium]
MRSTVLLYNPHSTSPGKQRLPMSLMAIAALIAADYDIELIDGNLIEDPATHIIERAKATGAKLLSVTVMPGPQIRQAVPVCKAIKAALPDLTILWGGYFPSNHAEVTLKSDFVDYAIIGQGEIAFRKFVDTLHQGGSMDDVPSLAYMRNGELQENLRAPFAPVDNLPMYPFDQIDVAPYVGSSYLGKRVGAHHSSWGCPFACNFCAIVPLAKRRWLAESPERVIETMRYWKDCHNIDGMEFHDMDFFVKEDRAAAIAEGMIGMDINWWGLGRVDTLMSYSDTTFDKLAKSGLKMVFMGAESGDDETLKRMNKGGQSGVAQTVAIVERMQHYGIVPELSFVLGNPPDPLDDIEKTIKFIRKLKAINPDIEIILYIYTPTPQEGSLFLDEAYKLGFSFPETLEEWAGEEWTAKALRRDPGTPWVRDPVRRRVRDFETVINAYYPTTTDMRLQGAMRRLLKLVSGWRYTTGIYQHPYELKALQRLLRYRRPETMGF